MTDLDPRLGSRHRRRRHPAVGARIAAAGVGLSTMLGLVAVMGIANAAADQGAADAVPSTASLTLSPTPGVVHTDPVPVITASPTPVGGSPQAVVDPAPVTLTARPDVRVVTPQVTPAPAAPAPASTTHGSR